jgi:hypothetical protein
MATDRLADAHGDLAELGGLVHAAVEGVAAQGVGDVAVRPVPAHGAPGDQLQQGLP